MATDHMKFERLLRANLLAMANAFASAKDWKLSTVGRASIGDSRFFDKLAAPKPSGFNISTYGAAMAWFDEEWPEGADKPALWDPLVPAEAAPRRKK
jgi:hypothetical protein